LRKRCPSRYKNSLGHQIDLAKVLPQHIVIKIISAKNKERILKAVREKTNNI
jgi:hypothetical protein